MTRTMMLTAAAALALTLAACNQPEPAEPPVEPAAPAAPATPDASGPPVSAADKLTAEGFGSIRVGQTITEVDQAYGPPETPLADAAGCVLFHPVRAPAGILVMAEGGRVSRVSATRSSTVETDRAFNIGDTAAAVKAAYGDDARATPHKYQEAPAEDIYVWRTGGGEGAAYVTDPTARGVRYEIGGDGRVMAIHAGGPSIQLVEGCN